jgi:ribonuclease D
MREKLSSLGRLAWLEDDFRRYESPERYLNDPEQAWQRIRGNDRLNAKQTRVLQALAQWREQLAQSENRPRAWMLRDNVLMDIARLCPEDRKELANIRQIPEHVVVKQGDDLLQLISDAIESEIQLIKPESTRRAKASQKQEALVDVLQAQLVLLAEKNAINPAALATKKQLVALVMGERDIPILNGWRNEMAGKELLALIEGKRIISVRNNELVFSDIQ